ncbi:MAG: hypothetical protein GEU94_22670, partial [Micromonosporaceae bacterium]|nr:hypothetical protein [Micromonosporaceae bacterium]
RAALIGAAVLAGQLSIGWSNDWFDAARDRAAGRRSKPLVSGALPVSAVAVAASLAGFVTAVWSLSLGVAAGALHIAGVAAGWLYNWPLKATAASVLPYLVGFGALPAFAVIAAGRQPPAWLIAAGALLGASGHFANVLPDLADDARTGVRGLPHRLGAAGSRVTVVCCLLLAGGAVVFGPDGPTPRPGLAVLAGAAVALVGSILTRRRYGERLLFHVVIGVALAFVALLLTNPAL